jgi:hypothetical protein
MNLASTNTGATSAGVTLLLAATLERLTARIDRDLNAEAAEGVQIADPEWAAAITSVVDYAQECLRVLDLPDVDAALSSALAAQHAS